MNFSAVVAVLKFVYPPLYILEPTIIVDWSFPIYFSILLIIIISIAIISSTLIYYFHDLQLIKDQTIHHKRLFRFARVLNWISTVAWFGILLYTIAQSVIAVYTCHDICDGCHAGNVTISGGNCTYIDWNTIHWVPPQDGVSYINRSHCDHSETVSECKIRNPIMADDILLAMVVIVLIYNSVTMMFRSYIYTITIPEYVLIFEFMEQTDLTQEEKEKKILDVTGKMEFGRNWSVDQFYQDVDSNRTTKSSTSSSTQDSSTSSSTL